jgi:hypothetical protein
MSDIGPGSQVAILEERVRQLEAQNAMLQASRLSIENSFKEQLIEHLVIDCIYQKEHETNPRKAVQDLISWEVQIALDPQVSSDAAGLIERGRKEKQATIMELQRLLRLARAEVEYWTPDEACYMTQTERAQLNRWYDLRDLIDVAAPPLP